MYLETQGSVKSAFSDPTEAWVKKTFTERSGHTLKATRSWQG